MPDSRKILTRSSRPMVEGTEMISARGIITSSTRIRLRFSMPCAGRGTAVGSRLACTVDLGASFGASQRDNNPRRGAGCGSDFTSVPPGRAGLAGVFWPCGSAPCAALKDPSVVSPIVPFQNGRISDQAFMHMGLVAPCRQVWPVPDLPSKWHLRHARDRSPANAGPRERSGG